MVRSGALDRPLCAAAAGRGHRRGRPHRQFRRGEEGQAIGKGAKANHLSYLGDGTVGAGANIGAGTIFCNYDGFDKQFETHVGEAPSSAPTPRWWRR